MMIIKEYKFFKYYIIDFLIVSTNHNIYNILLEEYYICYNISNNNIYF